MARCETTPERALPLSGKLLPSHHRDQLLAVADATLKQVDQQLGILRCLRGVEIQLLEGTDSVKCRLNYGQVLRAERRLDVLRNIIDHGRKMGAPRAIFNIVIGFHLLWCIQPVDARRRYRSCLR